LQQLHLAHRFNHTPIVSNQFFIYGSIIRKWWAKTDYLNSICGVAILFVNKYQLNYDFAHSTYLQILIQTFFKFRLKRKILKKVASLIFRRFVTAEEDTQPPSAISYLFLYNPFLYNALSTNRLYVYKS